MKINSHQDHTASYYAATANKQTVYEQLNGHKKTDVCVIGAGFTGISTALHLAERGYKVHVLEANKVGWGASGRNGGQMIGGISGESRLSRDLSKINEKIVTHPNGYIFETKEYKNGVLPVSYTHLTLPTNREV